jgi:MFS family permease
VRGSRWIILIGIALGRTAFGMQFQAIASLGPALVRAFHIDYAALGGLIGLYMLPGIVVALPGGVIGRRFGDRLAVGVGLMLMMLGALGSGLAAGPLGLGLGRVIAGSGAVVLAVMMGKVTADWFPGRGFLVAMGVAIGAFPLGVGLCQLATPILLGAFGWQGVFLAGALIAGIAWVLIVVACPRQVPGTAQRGTILPSTRECVLVILAGTVWTFYNAGYFGYLSYVPALLAGRGHGGAEIGLVMTAATWSNIPLILLGGVLAARLGNWPVFAIGMASLIVGVVGTAAFALPLPWALLFGTLGSIQTGVIVAAGTLSARPENRAVGMGMFYTVYYLGGAVLPAVDGMAADRSGSPAGALVAAAFFALLAVPVFALHQRLAARHGVVLV